MAHPLSWNNLYKTNKNFVSVINYLDNHMLENWRTLIVVTLVETFVGKSLIHLGDKVIDLR